jgi:secondary thiamine-phosphate synthase enzyme
MAERLLVLPSHAETGGITAQCDGFDGHFLSTRNGGIISIAMKIVTDSISLSTRGDADIIDITPHVSAMLGKHGFTHGQALVFVSGSTAGVTTIEYEPGLLKDIPAAFEKIAPQNAHYHHEDTWHDGNGHSHVRAAMLGCSLTTPFKDGRLLLGTWQQIVLIDFDNRPRRREVVVQILGE